MYLSLDPNSGVPLGSQIIQGLRRAVALRRVVPGEQLPSARALAADLGVNFHTVRRAYGELEGQGVLEFRRGLGTFVAAGRPAPRRELRRLVRERVAALFEELAGSEVDLAEVAALLDEEVARYRSKEREHR